MRNIQICSCILLLTIVGCSVLETSRRPNWKTRIEALRKNVSEQMDGYAQEFAPLKKEEFHLTAEYCAMLTVEEGLLYLITDIVDGNDPELIQLRSKSFDESKKSEYQLFLVDLISEGEGLFSQCRKYNQEAHLNRNPTPNYNPWHAYQQFIQKIEQHDPSVTKKKCEIVLKPILYADANGWSDGWSNLSSTLEQRIEVRNQLLVNYERMRDTYDRFEQTKEKLILEKEKTFTAIRLEQERTSEFIRSWREIDERRKTNQRLDDLERRMLGNDWRSIRGPYDY